MHVIEDNELLLIRPRIVYALHIARRILLDPRLLEYDALLYFIYSDMLAYNGRTLFLQFASSDIVR